MILVDSNILIYAINSRSPKNKTAQSFLRNSAGNFSVAHQNILETLRVLTHPKFPNHMKIQPAIFSIEAIVNAAIIISPDYKTHKIALNLIHRYKLTSDEIFDAYLAATALANEIHEIATDNEKDFRKMKEIRLINPFKFGGKKES